MSIGADVKQGDEVIVLQHRREPIPAVVEKAGRVWLDIRAKDGPRYWRMRRDTQMESWGSKTPGAGLYQACFLTLEQHAVKQSEAQARSDADQLGKRIAELLSMALDARRDPKRAKLAQEALDRLSTSAFDELLFITEGIA